jgi:lipopolysaccharide transport system ATP-binding protein
MNPSAISVEDLSKRYSIGHHRNGSDGLRHIAEDAFRSPLRWLRNLQQSRKDSREVFWALKNVSLEIQQGDTVGIMGRNGAGKSTLLKILSRITDPTSGRIRIRGRVASLLEVGTGFHQELTGRENIYLNGAILGMRKSEIRQKFDEIVAFSEIERFLDTPVKRYSSGMYVRLAFAVAAHLEPEILIVDEVLAVGDAAFQKKCIGKMGEVSQNGRTVLFVSHNMSAIRSLCNNAVLLSKGTVEQVGTVESIANRYLENLRETPSLDTPLHARTRAGHFGSKLRIHRVRINNGEGIWHDRPVKIEIWFECLAKVEDVSFGVGFCNREGMRILSLDSDNVGKRWNLISGQRGTALIHISRLHLEPDLYTMDIGCRSGDTHGLDYLPQFGQVSVSPSDSTLTMFATRESGRGGVRQPSETAIVFESN